MLKQVEQKKQVNVENQAINTYQKKNWVRR